EEDDGEGKQGEASGHAWKSSRGRRRRRGRRGRRGTAAVLLSALSALSAFSALLGCPPKPPQRPHIRRVAQLLEGALADLANALARHAEQLADLLEGQGFRALLEAVVQAEDLALAGREVALEDAVDELALQAAVGHLLDLAAASAGDPLAEGAGAA